MVNVANFDLFRAITTHYIISVDRAQLTKYGLNNSFLEQFIKYNACMYYVCIQIIMIKARIRWCTCRVENILTLGKLLSLWFCFLLHSILFLISQTSYRTYKIISRYELARPIMGTIFLVGTVSSTI